MPAKLTYQYLCIALLSGGLFACGSDNSDSSDEATDEPVNSAPVVDAGADQTVAAEQVVTLTVTVTDDDTTTLLWSQTAGTTVILDSTSAATVSFTAPSLDTDEILTFTVSADDGVNSPVSDSVNVTVTAASDDSGDSDTPVTDSVWLMNTDETRAVHILESDSSLGVLVNVQSVSEAEVNGSSYTVVTSEGIPDYSVTITQDMLDELNTRPRAASDFANGAAIVAVGDVVEFGQDVGYNSNPNCGTNAGYGYWPPGPDCPTQSTREVYFPNEPTATQEECANGLGKIGLWVNGSSVFNWGDGMSYANGVWQNLAPVAEQYDVDICGGHAANGDYHHHFYSTCLANMVGDLGDGHSPLYGYAADGYPIYGPWEADGQLAVSAWVVRDYSAESATGCSDGTRSCALIDPYDVSLGTELVTQGPDFDQVVETLSGNELVAYNGFYYEDYYWDSALTEQGGNYLDQYNAHYDEVRGYHYHITVVAVDGKLTPSFPYIVGTRFAGQLDDNAVTSCSTGAGPGGPPPGGGGGGPGGISDNTVQ